ncbi:hypothetical protein HN51_027577 [Arachis hypogaea]|nr:Linoleate 9S-lipoxygenase [Arachis hypogaea]
MEQENAKKQIKSMIMMSTMIWATLMWITALLAPFLEELPNILTLAGVELEEQRQKKDPKSEAPSSSTYVPRDEIFGHLKSSDFLTYGIKSLAQNVLPRFQSVFGLNSEFDSFDDARAFFEGGIYLPTDVISDISPLPVLKEIFRTDGEQVLKFPPPHVIQVSKSAWMTDEEFAREVIAGVNPNVIKRLEVFPPQSTLDPSIYGDQTSAITKGTLESNLEGLTVDEALERNKLFILDYHDAFMPYLRKISGLKS